jgi:sec-independent protein translocase protein TatA
MGLENPLHILILLVVVLLVFGAKRLPEMGRSLGDGMRGFKESLSGESAHAALPAAHVASVSAAAPAPAPVAFGRAAGEADTQTLGEQSRQAPRAA